MRKFIFSLIGLIIVLTISACSVVKTPVNNEAENISEVEETVVTSEVMDKIIIKENINYVGILSDIQIHMTLSVYSDGSIEGVYYYDKYNKNIEINGKKVGMDISLVTKDNSETFVGKINGGTISGIWTSGKVSLPFYIELENEKYGKTVNQTMVSDGEYIYYIVDNFNWSDLYKYKIDSSENIKITEVARASGLDIYGENIFYLNRDGKLSTMDKNGENQKEIFSQSKVVNGFIIYKNRIYFHNDMESEKTKELVGKLISVDLQGNNYKEVVLPEYKHENENLSKFYLLETIYRDYAYFDCIENGTTNEMFRVKIDGTGKTEELGLGTVEGLTGDEFFYYGTKANILYKNNVHDKSSGEVEVFAGKDYYKSTDVIDVNTFINEEYIVYNYLISYYNYNYLTVMNLEGKELNKINIPKLSFGVESQNEKMRTFILGEYIYFLVSSNYNSKGYLGRLEILGNKVEVLATLE